MEQRLGDLIDDYCPRCRLLLNHAIAGMVNGGVAKVVCQTCHTEHPYRHGEGGKKKPEARAVLFDQVVAKMPSAPPLGEPPAPAAPPKKQTATPARYISRHQGKPPRKSR
ncbi:MAG: hypothetical protein ACRD4Q_12980 [Candidatus Acidiferrales bacterium]